MIIRGAGPGPPTKNPPPQGVGSEDRDSREALDYAYTGPPREAPRQGHQVRRVESRMGRRSISAGVDSVKRLDLELGLGRLAHVEVRLERRPDLLHERLELRVLDRGQNRLADRVEHRLVVGDLVVEEGRVERLSALRLELQIG